MDLAWWASRLTSCLCRPFELVFVCSNARAQRRQGDVGLLRRADTRRSVRCLLWRCAPRFRDVSIERRLSFTATRLDTSPAGIERKRRHRALRRSSIESAPATSPPRIRGEFDRELAVHGGILVFKGVDRRRPIDAHSGRYTPDQSTFRAPSVRTSEAGERLVAFFAATGQHRLVTREMPRRLSKVGLGFSVSVGSSRASTAGRRAPRRRRTRGARPTARASPSSSRFARPAPPRRDGREEVKGLA